MSKIKKDVYVIRSKTSEIIFVDRMVGENLGREIYYEDYDRADTALEIFQSGYESEELYIKKVKLGGDEKNEGDR